MPYRSEHGVAWPVLPGSVQRMAVEGVRDFILNNLSEYAGKRYLKKAWDADHDPSRFTSGFEPEVTKLESWVADHLVEKYWVVPQPERRAIKAKGLKLGKEFVTYYVLDPAVDEQFLEEILYLEDCLSHMETYWFGQGMIKINHRR